MLPFKTSHGREAYKRLRVFIGVPENIDIKSAEKIEDALYRRVRNKVTLGEVSRYLGAKF